MDNLQPDLSLILQDSFRYGSSVQSPNRTDNIYLLGYSITHSLAPALHNTAFFRTRATMAYHILESREKQKLMDQLSQNACIGATVTMPHKVTFIPFVDEITDEGNRHRGHRHRLYPAEQFPTGGTLEPTRTALGSRSVSAEYRDKGRSGIREVKACARDQRRWCMSERYLCPSSLALCE